jgi:hypothetical protein
VVALQREKTRHERNADQPGRQVKEEKATQSLAVSHIPSLKGDD